MIEIIDFTNCKLSKRNLEYAGRPLVDVVEYTIVSIGYGCLILQIDLTEE